MAESGADGARRARRTLPYPARQFLELFVLCGFAVAQPLLDVTGRSPETFVFYRVEGGEVVAFALLIVVVPPLLLWLVVSGVRLWSAMAGRVAHAVAAGGLIALVVLQAGKKVSDLRGPLLVAASVVVALFALFLLLRSAAFRTFLTYLTPAPLVFAMLFLLASPTADLVRPHKEKVSTPGTPSSSLKPPVVMILFDEFPLTSLLDSEGQIDERVFPNFARLQQSGHWYRNGTAVSTRTQYAVPAILTGRYPDKELAPSYLQYPDNLFSLLAPDYRIRSFETITQLCDPTLCGQTEPARDDLGLSGLFRETWRVAKGIAKPSDDSGPSEEQFAEESVGRIEPAERQSTIVPALSGPNWKALKGNQPVRFQRFLTGLRRSEQPTMHFLHLLLPHSPWRHLPSGATYPDRDLGMGPDRTWVKHARPVEVARQRHFLQLAYTDRLLGEVIDRLQKQGIWDESLVVVTADHGKSFTPGTSRRSLAKQPDHEAQIAWVPVFLKEPGQAKGSTSDANWEQIDLLPTVADALGISVPFEVDGISHLSGTRESRDKHFFNGPDKRLTFPGPPAFKLVLEGITDTLIRGSHGQAGLYQTGSRPDWIGRKVDSLTSHGVFIADARSTMTARLAPGIDFRNVEPSSGSVPALVSGRLTNSVGRGPVVIAVNGTVAAVSEIWPEKGQPSFAGMVNDALFRAGANELTLFELVGRSDPQLRRIGIR